MSLFFEVKPDSRDPDLFNDSLQFSAPEGLGDLSAAVRAAENNTQPLSGGQMM
ncbi:hypothetical protein Q604_UNBC00120G0001, partial [human gut metagenome]